MQEYIAHLFLSHCVHPFGAYNISHGSAWLLFHIIIFSNQKNFRLQLSTLYISEIDQL